MPSPPILASPLPMPPGRMRCWNAATPRRRASRWRRPSPLPPACPRGKPAISRFSACSWQATPRPPWPRCPTHLNAWPRDAMVLGTTAFTNGLIGSSGRAGQKRTLLGLLDRLAPKLRRRLVVRRSSRHGAFGERPARCRPPEDRSLPRAEPDQSVGGARERAPWLRGGRSERGPRLPGVVADHLSAQRLALQPSELASRARRS